MKIFIVKRIEQRFEIKKTDQKEDGENEVEHKLKVDQIFNITIF